MNTTSLRLKRGALTLSLDRFGNASLLVSLFDNKGRHLAYAAGEWSRCRISESGDGDTTHALWVDRAAFDLRAGELKRVRDFLAGAQ